MAKDLKTLIYEASPEQLAKLLVQTYPINLEEKLQAEQRTTLTFYKQILIKAFQRGELTDDYIKRLPQQIAAYIEENGLFTPLKDDEDLRYLADAYREATVKKILEQAVSLRH